MFNTSLPPAPRLLDVVRDRIRLKHDSLRTGQAYVGWIRRYIIYHGKRHPRDMGKAEVEAFLSALAVEREVSAATLSQALAASLFLYREVLERPLNRANKRFKHKMSARSGAAQKSRW